jgi:aminoglycoside phosphotransferase (APT) family kinase protein
MPTPAAEVHVDEDLLRTLLVEQHPDLAHLPLEVVANGWDNVIVRVGESLVARLPRRAAAADLVLHEQRWLPSIADLVAAVVPVPAPVRVGVPGAGYPWSWSIGRWFPGVPAATLDPVPDAVAPALAAFVELLHVPAPPDAPVNPVRGGALADRGAAVAARLASGRVPRAAEAGRLWDSAVSTAGWDGPPVWLHGDLYPFNLIVDGGRLAAVIDFGDVTAGDPATDLASAWLTFGQEARRTFRASVTTDDATWMRARGWAIAMATALVVASDDHPAMHAVGVRALDAVLDDSTPRESAAG